METYELRRSGYAPLGDDEYEVVATSSLLEELAAAQVLDSWLRGEGRCARYTVSNMGTDNDAVELPDIETDYAYDYASQRLDEGDLELFRDWLMG